MDKIKFKEKLAYATVNFGNIPLMTIINGYLLIFYTNICGLSPAACATLFLIARILDGLNDPLVGFVLDHLPNTKYGHFRPSLIVGTILCSANSNDGSIRKACDSIYFLYFTWNLIPCYGHFTEQSSAGYDRRYE